MNIEQLANKLYTLRVFHIGNINFSWLEHEEAWIISTDNSYVYGYMDNPYSIVLFKLAYHEGMIEEITEEIPLNKVNEKTIANTIAKIDDECYKIESSYYSY